MGGNNCQWLARGAALVNNTMVAQRLKESLWSSNNYRQTKTCIVNVRDVDVQFVVGFNRWNNEVFGMRISIRVPNCYKKIIHGNQFLAIKIFHFHSQLRTTNQL